MSADGTGREPATCASRPQRSWQWNPFELGGPRMHACSVMSGRAYSFLDTVGLAHMPNQYGLPVFLVRRKGDEEYERQPASSIEEAVRNFIVYAEVNPGQIVEALRPGADPLTDEPFTYTVKG